MSGIGNGIYIELWLTHQFEAGKNFADDILNAFSWMKIYEFCLGFH